MFRITKCKGCGTMPKGRPFIVDGPEPNVYDIDCSDMTCQCLDDNGDVKKGVAEEDIQNWSVVPTLEQEVLFEEVEGCVERIGDLFAEDPTLANALDYLTRAHMEGRGIPLDPNDEASCEKYYAYLDAYAQATLGYAYAAYLDAAHDDA